MPISEEMLSEANLFLTTYNNALKVLQHSAAFQRTNFEYQKFLSEVIELQDKRKKYVDEDLIKKLRLFQFSHYYFLKYLGGIEKMEPTELCKTLNNTWKSQTPEN